jgi:hypothetical protein
MIDWHEQVVRGRMLDADWAGQRAGVGADTWQALYQTFGSFEREHAWRAALSTMDLFRRLAVEVAASARLTYPAELDRSVSEYIQALRDRRPVARDDAAEHP